MRTKLARTLLVLGVGLPACERAEPLADRQARPAVGNLGQTGRPLVARDATPAVGNLGQTGGPAVAAIPRPVPRAIRTASRAKPIVARALREARTADLAFALEPRATGTARADTARITVEPREVVVEQATPLVDRHRRPAAGNVMRKGGWDGPVDGDLGLAAAPQPAALEPLVTRTERPATGNAMGKVRPRRATERLAAYVAQVDLWAREYGKADTAERRAYCRVREHEARRLAEQERRRLQGVAP